MQKHMIYQVVQESLQRKKTIESNISHVAVVESNVTNNNKDFLNVNNSLPSFPAAKLPNYFNNKDRKKIVLDDLKNLNVPLVTQLDLKELNIK